MVVIYNYPSKKKGAGIKGLFNLVGKKKENGQWLKVKRDRRIGLNLNNEVNISSIN